MSRIVVIGGSGHIGSYLIPRLVEQGHDVISVSRGKAKAYRDDSAAWRSVEQVIADRDAEDVAGTFAQRIAKLEADTVIDLISFKLSSTQALVEALRGNVEHFLHCSTIWVYGHLDSVPADESKLPNPFGDYGVQKAEIEAWLLREAWLRGFPATVFRPGHIVGEGWDPIGPYGNVDPEAFARMARGDEITLPNFGLEMLHHIHADDVARFVMCAMARRSAAVGEAFNVVSDQAITLRGYAEAVYGWHGHEPRIRFMPFLDWAKGHSPSQSHHAWEHISRSSCLSNAKARELLGFRPNYSSLDAIKESTRFRSGEATLGHTAPSA